MSLLSPPSSTCAQGITMAVSSNCSKKTNLKMKSQEDRISELPKEVLLHILTFLDIKQLIQTTTLLSKKWKNLWKSLPILTFSNNASTNFIDKVIQFRNTCSSRVERFHLESEGFDVGDNLVSLVNQGVEEIKILGRSSRFLLVDSSVFTDYSQVRMFELQDFGNEQIHLPISMCCSQKLTYLHLFGVILPLCNSNGELHFVCPNLEYLLIRQCYCDESLRLLDISCPKLSKLVIHSSGGEDDIKGCKLEIRSPNLTLFEYRGNHIYGDCFVVDLPHLVDVSFLMEEWESGMQEAISCAIKLLGRLYNAKNLTLQGIEVFSAVPNTMEKLLSPFINLRNLKFRSFTEKSETDGMEFLLNSTYVMAYLLKSCGLIESLDLQTLKGYGFYTSEGEDKVFPQRKLCRLKFVKIATVRHRIELEFAKFLLKSAPYLEEMNIFIDSSVRDLLQHFTEELLALPRPSPSTKFRILYSKVCSNLGFSN